MDNITFYTDGSVLPQHGCGGYAAVPLSEDGQADPTRTISGAKPSNDIQEMELMAVVTAIRSAPKSHSVTIYTDHKTICDVIARNERSKCEKGRNRNIWNQLRQLCQSREITLHWVRAHAGNLANAAADRAARTAARNLVTKIAAC